MAKVNKVVYGDDTLIDLTDDTVTEDTLAKGVTAHDAAGIAIEGTFEDAIQHIKVNGDEQPIEDYTVDIDVPTKVSELDNDVPYVEQEAQSAIDEGFDARITALEESSDWVYVDGEALVFTSKASYSDEVLTITGDASVSDETLVFGGSSTGGGMSVHTFSASVSGSNWTQRTFDVDIDTSYGTPLGVVGIWTDNNVVVASLGSINSDSVTVITYGFDTNANATVYVNVLFG